MMTLLCGIDRPEDVAIVHDIVLPSMTLKSIGKEHAKIVRSG